MGTVVAAAITQQIEQALSMLSGAVSELSSNTSSLDTAELLQVADALENTSRRIEYGQVLLATAIDRNSPPDVGALFRNTAEFLQARLRISRAEARRRINLGTKLLPEQTMTGEKIPARYPLLASVASQGAACRQALHKAVDALDDATAILSNQSWPQLSPDASELLGRMEANISTALVERDPDFIASLLKRWTLLIDQDGTAPDDIELKRRQGLFRRGQYRGLNHFELWADALQTETLLTVLNAGNNPRTSSNRPTVDQRSGPQRQLDTLVSAMTAALTTDTLPETGGQRPQVHVTIDYRQLVEDLNRLDACQACMTPADPTGDSTGPARLSASSSSGSGSSGSIAQFGGPIRPGNIRKIACDAEIIPVVLGGTGEILDVGRRQRYFSRSQRAALVARDRGCTFPDCTIPASWCEAHHVRWWKHGGETSTENGALLCSHHHHVIHQGHWTMETRKGSIEFRPPPWVDPRQMTLRNSYHQI